MVKSNYPCHKFETWKIKFHSKLLKPFNFTLFLLNKPFNFTLTYNVSLSKILDSLS